jgi:hypothetical protein
MHPGDTCALLVIAQRDCSGTGRAWTPHKRQAQAASHEDVRAFIATLEQPDERFDATEAISASEMAQLADESPARPAGLILAKNTRRGMKYYCGIHRDRAVFSFDVRLAHVFASENEIVALVFNQSPELNNLAGSSWHHLGAEDPNRENSRRQP